MCSFNLEIASKFHKNTKKLQLTHWIKCNILN